MTCNAPPRSVNSIDSPQSSSRISRKPHRRSRSRYCARSDQRVPREFSQARDIEMIKMRVAKQNQIGRRKLPRSQRRSHVSLRPEHKRLKSQSNPRREDRIGQDSQPKKFINTVEWPRQLPVMASLLHVRATVSRQAPMAGRAHQRSSEQLISPVACVRRTQPHKLRTRKPGRGKLTRRRGVASVAVKRRIPIVLYFSGDPRRGSNTDSRDRHLVPTLRCQIIFEHFERHARRSSIRMVHTSDRADA